MQDLTPGLQDLTPGLPQRRRALPAGAAARGTRVNSREGQRGTGFPLVQRGLSGSELLLPPLRLAALELSLRLSDEGGELRFLLGEFLLEPCDDGFAALDLFLADLDVGLEARLALLDLRLALVEVADPLAQGLLHRGEPLITAVETLARRVGQRL